jgi:hypothetical protein
MIGLGTTLRCILPPRHIYVVLSDPFTTGGRILLANLTTLDEDCVDDACILGPADYPRLTHPMTVACSRAQAGTVKVLQELIAAGSSREITPVPEAVLKKIFKGAHETRGLSASQKRLLPQTQHGPDTQT